MRQPGTKKRRLLSYGATAPRTYGLSRPATGLTVTGRTLAAQGEGGKSVGDWGERNVRAVGKDEVDGFGHPPY